MGKRNPTFDDLILFREFRYRFDPSWRSDATLGQEYRDVSSPWTTVWELWAWCLSNFPMLLRSLETTPNVHVWKEMGSWLEFS
jgi:hypothetical protein